MECDKRGRVKERRRGDRSQVEEVCYPDVPAHRAHGSRVVSSEKIRGVFFFLSGF